MAKTVTVCITPRRLAALSGLSLSTVNKVVPKLKKSGYLSVTRCRARYNREKGRYEGQAFLYSCRVPKKGYTLIP